mgnify:CR=1 FL=1
MAFVALTASAQNLKFALVKDEGGETNIRKGPGTKYAVVEKMPDGFFVNCIPTKAAWTKVYTTYTSGEDQEFIGYIATSKLVFPKRQGAWKMVGQVKEEGGYTNIRKGPGTNYAIVGKVKDGSYILWSGNYEDKWYKVYTQKGVLRGYMSSSKILALESPSF